MSSSAEKESALISWYLKAQYTLEELNRSRKEEDANCKELKRGLKIVEAHLTESLTDDTFKAEDKDLGSLTTKLKCTNPSFSIDKVRLALQELVKKGFEEKDEDEIMADYIEALEQAGKNRVSSEKKEVLHLVYKAPKEMEDDEDHDFDGAFKHLITTCPVVIPPKRHAASSTPAVKQSKG